MKFTNAPLKKKKDMCDVNIKDEFPLDSYLCGPVDDRWSEQQ